MKISTKGRYGLRAMIDLAIFSSQHPVSIKDIAKRQDISVLYLEQIFALLKKHSLVLSRRGVKGGYLLAKEAKDINLKEVIEAVEGPIQVVPCLGEDQTCGQAALCPTVFLWKRINQSVERVLEAYTLEDMVVEAKYKNSDLL